MLRKELAAQLGISASMVSRLARRGMPTDSVARAERWRRRHLEPGRVKGMRLDTITDFDLENRPLEFDGVDPREVVQTVQEMGVLVDTLVVIEPDDIAEWSRYLRRALRRLPGGFRVSFTCPVWLALLDHCLPADSPLRTLEDHDFMSVEEVAFAVATGVADFAPDTLWELACRGPMETSPAIEEPVAPEATSEPNAAEELTVRPGDT